MDTNYAAREGRPQRTARAASPGGVMRALRVGFWLALAVQVYVLYLYVPSASGAVTIPHADKAVHAAIFAVPALVGVLSGLRPWLVGLVLLVHAPVSEVVQQVWIPGRSGEPWDVVADWAGVALAVAVAVALRRRDPSRRQAPA